MRTLFFLFIFCPLVVFSQVQQPGRYEIELETFEAEYEVLSGDENGLLLYKPLDIYNGRNQLWRFVKLDTALHEDWIKEIYLDRSHVYKGYDYSNSNYSFLFQITSQGSLDLLLLQLDDYNGDTTQHRIKNLVTISLEAFEMTDNAAIIGGYYNQDPIVMHYDLREKKTKVLPGIFGNKTDLMQVKVDQDYIRVLLTTRSIENSNTLALKTYDADGNYLDSYTFNPAEDVGLNFGRVTNIGTNGSLVCGTYGARKSDYSRGLFIAQHTTEIEQDIRYFNYADLENFFSYMKAKRQKRISEKIDRKKVSGKKIKFNYRLLVHDILEYDDGYIMLGEAFYPKYNGTAYSAYGGYGANDFSSRDYIPTTFSGYYYTHAVVIGFNSKGEVLWDNSFQIEDVTSYQLEQFVHADIIDDKVILLYLYENDIRTKIISGSEVLEGKSFNNLRLTFEDDVVNDKTSYSNIGGLEKWYGHNFMAYGVQKIKNLKDQGVKLNRRVFYINKIRYDKTYTPAADVSAEADDPKAKSKQD